MSDLSRRTLADLVLCALTLGGAALLFVGAAELPPPRWEPLGSAALPRILGGLLVLFALIVAARALLRHRAGASPAPAPEGEPQADPVKGALVFAALVLYVFSLDVLRVPFVPATAAFVAAAGLAIGRRSLANAAIFAGLGLGLALTISLVLERMLYVRIG